MQSASAKLLTAGYIYAPYIPLYVTPTNLVQKFVRFVNPWKVGDIVFVTEGRPFCGKITSISKHDLCEIQTHPRSDERYHLNAQTLRRASLLEVLAWDSQ